jgi:hypothetical protein
MVNDNRPDIRVTLIHHEQPREGMVGKITIEQEGKLNDNDIKAIATQLNHYGLDSVDRYFANRWVNQLYSTEK